MGRVQLFVVLFVISFIWILLNLTGCQETTGGPVTCTTGDGTCGSRHCVDGYCCDSACGGTCQACNLPGKEGRCMSIGVGADPDQECGLCRVCGGDGACQDVLAGDDPKDDCDQWDPSTCGLTGDCDGTGQCANYGSDTPCDDQELCTYDDHCDGQGGCSGTGITCEPDSDPCAFQPVCNGTDICEETYPGQNTSCDDQNPCTYDDRCDGQGGCAGTTIACDDDPGPCGALRDCNGTNSCTVSFPQSSVTCLDGDPCTYDDRCDGQGGCAGTPLTCEDDPGPCGARRECNGTDTCTVTFPGVETTCQDNEPCTYDDRCDGQGGCDGTPLTCGNDPGPCGALRECNGTATCTVTYPGAETACEDDEPCTYDDRCDGQGSCSGTQITCDDGPSPCGALRDCNGTDTCTVAYPPAGIACDDGRFCSVGDQCDGAGNCSPGAGTPCQAGEVCYEDEDRCCQPSAYSACGADNDVYWFDSCDHQGSIRQDCPDPNGECAGGACYCRNHWTGADCLTCPGHWDPAQDCNACQGNWDVDYDCVWCQPGWVGSDCQTEGCVRYVDLGSTALNPGGLNWADAFTQVNEGINAARQTVTADPNTDVCEVWVAQGTYYQYRSGPGNTVQLMPSVHLYGGFTATEFSREQRDWEANPTVLDGHEFEASAGQVYHVVTGSTDAVLDGFTVSGGNAVGLSDDEDRKGGGIYSFSSSFTLSNCHVTENSAADMGGGVYLCASDVELVGCQVSGNSSTDGTGGGVHIVMSSPLIDNCLISGNSSFMHGGGISCWDSVGVIVTGSTISDNHSDMTGGGIHFEQSSVFIDGCLVSENTTAGPGGGISARSYTEITNTDFIGNSTELHGGGIQMDGSQNSFIDNCYFFNNTAMTGGGGVCFETGGSPLLSNSLVTGNSSEGGGGVQLVGSSARIIGCEISLNSTHSDGCGGGIYSDFSNPYIDDCNIWGNVTSGFGHGGGVFIANSGTAVVTNSYITDNASPHDGGGLFIGDSEPEISNCIIAGNTALTRGGGINFYQANEQTMVVNCTIVGNSAGGGDGIASANGSVITLVNSILWNNSPMEVYVPDWGDWGTINVSYSDIMGGESSILTSNNATVNWLNGNIDADPLFVDPAADDYHLSWGSPCIDTGTDTDAPLTDFDGDTRPWGSGYDIGADEYSED